MRRVIVVGVVVAIGAAVAVVMTRPHHRGPKAVEPVRVQVVGRQVDVDPGTTFGRVAQRFRIRPDTAPLLAVNGHVLRAHAYSSPLLLNGRPASPSRRLHSGDRITAPPAHPRREPLERIVVPVPDGLPPSPEYTLARAASTAVVVRGRLSHQIVDTALHAEGAAPPSVPSVALTFDDGPWPAATPRILAILQHYAVPATFFAIGYLAAAYPNLIRAEQAAGMEVGNHTYNHPEVPPFNDLPARLQDDEIELAAEDLRAAGVDPHLFRPPEGSFSPSVAAAAARARERVVLWSVDPADWQHGITAATIVRSVLAAVRPGSIVLLHDGGGDRSATIAALPAIIQGIHRRGLTLVTVDGL